MAPATNGRVIFAKVPKDFPVPGETTVYDTTQTIDIDGVPLSGGFLVKTLVLSVDPYFRGKMRTPEKKSYFPPFTLGEPIESHGVGVVLRTDNAEVAVGKYVYGMIPHQEYSIFPNMQRLNFIEKNPKLPWTVFVGAAGMPGQTSYYGWKELSQAKKGETAFITAGAGPVGSMVIQLAKRDGLKVIASAGSDEKVELMKQIGADVAFNYKTTNTREVLEREGPIDMQIHPKGCRYWDNVGGEILEAALDNANTYGRFIECGMISGYNTGPKGIKNLNQIIQKSVTMTGLLVFRFHDKYEKEFYEVVPAALASGGAEKGSNTGKAVVIVAED
ncbi:NAD P-binding protein [Mycena sanguinolenta]|uniref:NAD P-binding protein n=1 Tax=Mycena sanguinolenta TaxID=230812 RepID=A0A8H6ZHQ8_9AGAR|nr:NAD P-binding protein [Mycena sanguinolenta]